MPAPIVTLMALATSRRTPMTRSSFPSSIVDLRLPIVDCWVPIADCKSSIVNRRS
jgi:hypothetical protein